MTSSARKLDRKTVRFSRKTRKIVRRAIWRGKIRGTSPEACVDSILAYLKLSPNQFRPQALHFVNRLLMQGEIVLTVEGPRFTTDSEKRAMAIAEMNEVRRDNRTRQLSATKRRGGVRSLEVRSHKPLPAQLVPLTAVEA